MNREVWVQWGCKKTGRDSIIQGFRGFTSQTFQIYPLVICYRAIENGTLIVDLPIKDADFP